MQSFEQLQQEILDILEGENLVYNVLMGSPVIFVTKSDNVLNLKFGAHSEESKVNQSAFSIEIGIECNHNEYCDYMEDVDRADDRVSEHLDANLERWAEQILNHFNGEQ
jgi:hypothetical protein